MRDRLRCAALVAFVALVTSNGQAGPRRDPLVVLVLVRGPEDPLMARVRGQTSDLPVELRARATPAPGALAQEIRRAERRAAEEPADVVAWRRGSDLVVYTRAPNGDRVLVRPLTDSRARAAESARLEAAALIVRGAIRALLGGAPAGVPKETLAPPEPKEKPVSQPPPPPPPLARRWTLGAGLSGAVYLDGIEDPGLAGVARVHVSRGRWRGGLAWSEGLEEDIRALDTFGRYHRRTVSLLVGADLWQREELRLGVELHAGRLRTHVTPLTGTLRKPTDVFTWTLSGEAQLWWALRDRWLWLTPALGVLWAHHPAWITVVSPSTQVKIERVHTWQPTAAVGLTFLIP